MQITPSFVPLIFLAQLAIAAEPSPAPPWKVNPPIVTVKKELYKKYSKAGAAALVFVSHVGPNLQRREIHGAEIVDDVHTARVQRFSDDNGKTWSKFTALPSNDVRYGNVTVWEGNNYNPFYDPVAGVLVELWLRQIAHQGRYHQWTYYRLSFNQGRSWTEPKQLRYENGPVFDPKHPLNPEFLNTNQAYFGTNIIRHSNGTLILPVAHANAPGDPDNDRRAWRMGGVCFIGCWNAKRKDYDWKFRGRVTISPDRSSRGLMEPAVAELKDGRVLVVWRGSNTSKTPGRKWYCLSDDGGMTLSDVREWKYDDRSQFYSPSSIHKFIRHSVTGKLYWVGNICASQPSGNWPRFPLIIAEVDENIPALKKTTITVIDDRQPNQTPAIQFSNFSLLENRTTHAIELYLTCYGEFLGSVYTANNYKYTATLK